MYTLKDQSSRKSPHGFHASKVSLQASSEFHPGLLVRRHGICLRWQRLGGGQSRQQVGCGLRQKTWQGCIEGHFGDDVQQLFGYQKGSTKLRGNAMQPTLYVSQIHVLSGDVGGRQKGVGR